MDKTTLWFIVGFVALVVIVVAVAGATSGGFNTGSSAPAFVATVAPPIGPGDHLRGDATATVSLIEYGDYECPACEEYEPLVAQVLKNYGGRIEFVFRNFPLYSIHPLAGLAAQAAEAAALQGKFWQMHDALYAPSNWNQWTQASPSDVVSKYFDGYASSLGLDVAKFNRDIGSSAVANKIQSDVQGGNAAAIDHTPTFFVDQKQIPNPQNYADFAAALDAALGSSAASSSATSTPTATPPAGY